MLALEAEGFYPQWIDNILYSNDDAAAELFIDAFDALPVHKEEKVVELKVEGLLRINVIFPAIETWDKLELAREQWLSIIPAARDATVNWQSMIDIYQAGRDANAIINAYATILEVESYNVQTDPFWP